MKKIAILTLALVAILGVMGVGYALWSDTLYINGTVETGEVDISFNQCDWPWDEVVACYDSEPPEKDVSGIIRTFDANGNRVFQIYNAYPCIDYYAKFCLQVNGTIPVDFGAWNIDRGNLPASAILEVTPNLYNEQRHPGNHVELLLHVHLFNEGTTELTTYTFGGNITAGQWNEYP